MGSPNPCKCLHGTQLGTQTSSTLSQRTGSCSLLIRKHAIHSSPFTISHETLTTTSCLHNKRITHLIHVQMSALNIFFFNVAEFVIKGVHYSASEVLQHDHRAQLYRCFLQDFLRCKQNQDNWPDRLRRSSHRPTAGTENLLWALINRNKQKTT